MFVCSLSVLTVWDVLCNLYSIECTVDMETIWSYYNLSLWMSLEKRKGPFSISALTSRSSCDCTIKALVHYIAIYSRNLWSCRNEDPDVEKLWLKYAKEHLWLEAEFSTANSFFRAHNGNLWRHGGEGSLSRTIPKKNFLSYPGQGSTLPESRRLTCKILF